MGDDRSQPLDREPHDENQPGAAVLVVSLILAAVIVSAYFVWTVSGASDSAASRDEVERSPSRPATSTAPAVTPTTTISGPTEPTGPGVTVTLPAPTQSATGPVRCTGGTGYCFRGAVAGDIYHWLQSGRWYSVRRWYCTDEPHRVRCATMSTVDGRGTTTGFTVVIGTSTDVPARPQYVTMTSTLRAPEHDPLARATTTANLRALVTETNRSALPDEPVSRVQIRNWFDSHVGTNASARVAGYQLNTTAVAAERPGSWSAAATLRAG